MTISVTGQNGSSQNGTDKMVWTKWYTDKVVLDKMVWTKWYWTKWYGQNGIWTKWYWTKWYGQNGMDKMVWTFIHYGDLYSAPSRLLLRSAPDPCMAKKKSFETRVECGQYDNDFLYRF